MSRTHDLWEQIGETKPFGDWFFELLKKFVDEHPEYFDNNLGVSFVTARERVAAFYVWLEERYAKG